MIALRLGEELGPSSWVDVSQARIDLFGRATEDHESIHVTPALAAAGPYGEPVAHGFLTLSLLAHFWDELLAPRGACVVVNYGLGRVRFPAPVPAGARVRARFRVETLAAVEGGVQTTVGALVESDAGVKPVCAAELIFRLLDPPG